MAKKLFAVLLFLSIAILPSFSQDYFGQLSFPDGLNPQVSGVDSTDILYVGLWGNSLKKSLDGGKSWSNAMTGVTNLFINDIYVSPQNKIYLSTQGGIFLSTNQGATWTALNNGIGAQNVTCVRQHKSGMLIAGTYGKGVYISTNGGTSWAQSNTGLPYRAISSIEMSGYGYIILGTYGSGVYQSRDTAKTWSRSNSGILSKYIKSFAKLAIYPDIYVATNGAGVYVSPNEGVSWGEEDTTGLLDNNITALILDDDREEIIGTRNAGIQYFDKYLWNQWRTPFQSNVGITSITRSKSGVIYSFGTESNPMLSTNNGRNWTQMQTLRNQTPIKFLSWGNGNILAQYSPEVIKYSNDYGRTWQNTDLTNNTLATVCAVENNLIFAGTDKGLYVSSDGINWASTSITGTGVTGVAYKSGLVAVGTMKVSPGTPPPPPVCSFYTSNDYGATFTQKNYPIDSTPIVRMKVSSGNDIYTTMGNDLWRSINQGTSWENMTASLGFSVTDVSLNSSDNVFIATYNGMYRSQNRGQSWIYTNIHFLDTDSLGVSKININNDNVIYAVGLIPRSSTMASGLWSSTDNGNTWDSLYTNLTTANHIDLSSDGESNLYIASTSLFKHLNPQQMAAPAAILPQNNTKSADLSQTFKWSTTTKADLYEWQLSEYTDFGLLKSWVVQSDTSYLESNLDFNKTYYWHVRAKYHDSYSNWSDVFTFSTMLNAPILINPPNNSLGLPIVPTFDWYKVAHADYYHLQLATDNKFADLIMDSDSLADTTLVSDPLQINKSYFWRVKAYNEDGESPWSEIWNFQTTFGAPILISPRNDSVDVPINGKLLWGNVQSATYYNVMLSDSANFNNSQTFKVTSATNFDLNSHINYDKDYYWKVQAGNTQQLSNYSEPWHFTSIIAPLDLLLPANNTKNQSISPTLTWTENAKYGSYEILISELSTFQNVLIDTIITSPTYTPKNLKGYTKYFWKGRVKTENRQGEFSQTWNFQTELAQIGLRFPTNNSKGQKTTIPFLWFSTNGAKYYFLQIARDVNFNDLIFSMDSIQAFTYEVKNLLPKSTYFWRVRASNDDGVSAWSEVWIFETGSPVPILRYPENEAQQVPINLTFTWDTLENATSYFLQVSTDNTFNQLIYSNENILTNSQEVPGLGINTTYYWRVRAKFGDIDGDWSDIWTFRTTTNGIFEYTDNNEILSIYPNPVLSELHLNINIINAENCEINILDAYSRRIKTLYNGLVENINGVHSFAINNLPSGLYFLEFKTSSKIYVRKFIIIK